MSIRSAEVEREDFFLKSRPLYRPSGQRLLREPACVLFARRAVPPIVNGYRVIFPDARVSIGFHVSVKSQTIPGKSLHDMLRNRHTWDAALELGISALEVFRRAEIVQHPFRFFGYTFRVFSSWSLLSKAISTSRLGLRAWERRELRRLAWCYFGNRETPKTLVHGDLQPAHIIVDDVAHTLGIIDLEAMHIGNSSLNFAHLFTGYHYADPALGRRLREQYGLFDPMLFSEQYEEELRAAVALRCLKQIEVAERDHNAELAIKARALLVAAIACANFGQI